MTFPPSGASLPIADYAFISDCHRGALVSRGGSVDWMCAPRFDSPAVFGRLLDAGAGHWRIAPMDDDHESERRYDDGSLVLQTRFRTASGEVMLTDALATGPNERGHDLGMEAPGALLRRLECTRGRVALQLDFAPRPEYGSVHPVVEPCEGGLRSRGGPLSMVLSSPVPLEVDGSDAGAVFELEAGETAGFALHVGAASSSVPVVWQPDEVEQRLAETLTAWRSWAEMHQSYEGPWAEVVHHSGRVLQGLTYCPTGAIIAAPTTSLPELVGGERNWDYRFAWIRDASLTLEALWVAACPDEAHHFFDFLSGASLGRVRRGDPPQIMFGIGGEHELPEREIERLSGWRDSRPVRVGNAAYSQKQLDVYGELFGAVVRLRDYVEPEESRLERWKEVRGRIRTAIEERLTDEHGLVFRYLADDGLAGDEGTFLLCTFWLAHALALAGEVKRAREVFERACSFVNDVGLLAEEVDPATGELLGNFPQAFSHVGCVTAAWAIHQAEQRGRAPWSGSVVEQ